MIISTGPICAAHCSARQPCSSASSMSALAASRVRAATSCVLCAATISAVPPWRAMRAFTSARAVSRASIGACCPTLAACMSGRHSRTSASTCAEASSPSAAMMGSTRLMPSALKAETRSVAPSPVAGFAPCSSSVAAMATWPRESASTSTEGGEPAGSSRSERLRSSCDTLDALPLHTAKRRALISLASATIVVRGAWSSRAAGRCGQAGRKGTRSQVEVSSFSKTVIYAPTRTRAALTKARRPDLHRVPHPVSSFVPFFSLNGAHTVQMQARRRCR
jgi:hypothetical protein